MPIDGHWLGYYLQELVRRPGVSLEDIPENHFGIEAWFETEGALLTGKMIDLDCERECAYTEWLLGMHDGLPKKMRIERARYHAKYPNAVLRISGCPDSKIEGTVDGDFVNFSKVYSGPRESCIRNGNIESAIRHLCPTVFYYGVLSSDGSILSGTFEAVPWTESKNHVKGTGEFVLVRDEPVVHS